ncbi:hypothetical protein QYF36_019351 [Acer negundo]|nr:hypothetical protein QYF36_019351 [Acer negundo]
MLGSDLFRIAETHLVILNFTTSYEKLDDEIILSPMAYTTPPSNTQSSDVPPIPSPLASPQLNTSPGNDGFHMSSKFLLTFETSKLQALFLHVVNPHHHP